MINVTGIVATASVLAATLPAIAGCVLTDPGASATPPGWALYEVNRPGFDYTVEYPATWAAAEGPTALRLAPPEETAPATGITVVVTDPSETPPPPVHYTYTPIRLIEANGQAIPVVRRDPAPATEAYLVLLEVGRYTVEIRFALRDAHAAVFDHVVLSFSLSPKPE